MMKQKKTSLLERIAKEPQVTPFRRKVYEALLEVPPGRVTTYGLLGKRVGCASARAVGGALRENPFAPEVPCHRVVAADLSIGGFNGRREGGEIARKIGLLVGEGVPLDVRGRLLDARRVWRF
jgi:methylated-DNA-[protein]-cysteine S-methyltransferase